MKIYYLYILIPLIILLVMHCSSLEQSLMWPGASASFQIQDSNIEKHWLNTDEGPVEMWFAPVSTSQDSHKPTIIFAHGNGETMDWSYMAMKPYLEMGVNLAFCEYRGYGRSKGKPSQKNIVSDFICCYDWVIEKPGIDSTRIVFQGTSIGTGIACALAKARKSKALILISPLQNTRQLAKDKFPVLYPFFRVFGGFKNPFENDKLLKKYQSPVLIFHGNRDEVIPFSHGQFLHENSPQSTLIELDCGHNDVLSHSTIFWPTIQQFLVDQDILQSH